MDALAARLAANRRAWQPETTDHIRQRVTAMIAMADHDALDLLCSRRVDQDVLALLDAPTTR
jgi:hypothetical protein